MLHRTTIAGLIFVLGLLTLSACDNNDPGDTPNQFINGPPAKEVAESDYTVTGSGLKYFDFEVGTGPAANSGDTLFVDYTGWLTDGFIFDSSVYQVGRTPIRVILGTTNVIEGWTEGLQGIQEDGQRQIVIPSALGYGSFGSPPFIPPNATLIFEVQVVRLSDAG